MDKPYAIGIDVGGTNTVVGIVDKRGQILVNGSIKTAKHSEVEEYLDELTNLIDELIKKITDAVAEMYPEGLQLHHFHIHNYVTHQEMTFHIRLSGELSLEEGHSVATAIEKMIQERFNITSTIHVEPLDFEHP